MLPRPEPDDPIRLRPFQVLLAGQFMSSVGDLAYAVAFPWLVLGHGGTPATLGVLLSAFGLARAAGVLIGGPASDRLGCRGLMIVSDLVRAVVVVLMPMAITTGGIGLTAALVAVTGFFGGVFIPASYSILPTMLPEKQLTAGNSLSSIVTQAGTLSGPVIGGVLVAQVGTSIAFYLDGLTFLASALAVSYVARRAAVVERTTADDAPASLRELLRPTSLLWAVILIALIGNSVYAGSAEVALPALAKEQFDSATYAAFLLSIGVGLLVGGVLARTVTSRTRPAFLLAAIGTVMGASIAGLSLSPGRPACLLLLGLFGAGNGWSGVVMMSMIQVWAPPAMLGRVMSMLMLAIVGVFPLSVLVAGYGVEAVGPEPFFAVAGALIVLASVSGLAHRAYRTHGREVVVTVAAVASP